MSTGVLHERTAEFAHFSLAEIRAAATNSMLADVQQPNSWTSLMRVVSDLLVLLFVLGSPLMSFDAESCMQPLATVFTIVLVFPLLSCNCILHTVNYPFMSQRDYDVFNTAGMLQITDRTLFTTLRAKFDFPYDAYKRSGAPSGDMQGHLESMLVSTWESTWESSCFTRNEGSLSAHEAHCTGNSCYSKRRGSIFDKTVNFTAKVMAKGMDKVDMAAKLPRQASSRIGLRHAGTSSAAILASKSQGRAHAHTPARNNDRRGSAPAVPIAETNSPTSRSSGLFSGVVTTPV